MNNSVIYFLQRESDGLVKIGTTIKLGNRITALKKRHGKLRLLGIIEGGRVREKVVHDMEKVMNNLKAASNG